MREYREIPIAQIAVDRIPLNPTGLACACAVRQGIPMPPIKVVQTRSGNYRIKDGRHRYLAYKLNGKAKIYAQVSKEKYWWENIFIRWLQAEADDGTA